MSVVCEDRRTVRPCALIAAALLAGTCAAAVPAGAEADGVVEPRFAPTQVVATVDSGDVLGGGTVPILDVSELARGDLTGDGLDDIVVTRGRWASEETFPITILVNDGHGTFVDKTVELFEGPVTEPQGARQTVLADFNGDGRLDILIADTGVDAEPFPGYPSHLVLSTPDRRYVDASANLPREPAYTHTAAAADVDGDGDVDIFFGNLGTPVRLLLNDGAARFTDASSQLPASIFVTGHDRYTRSAFVDVDGNGAPDLVLAGEDHTASSVVLVNDGSGRFSEVPNGLPAKPFGSDAIGVAIQQIELNGDDRVDLLLGYTKGDPLYQGRWIQVLLNQGDGTFRDETASRLPQADNALQWPFDIVTGDLNRDGYTDFGVDLGPTFADPSTNLAPPFYLNRGDGTFAALSSSAFVEPPFQQFRLIDTNRDGRLDVFSAVDPGVGAPEVYAVSSQLAPIRTIEHACPTGVPDSGFTDVDAGNVHAAAIDCIAWWGITHGVSADLYQPAGAVSRAQMATFIAALVEHLGGDLPATGDDWFDDDDGTIHEDAINKLAAAGIVKGTAPRQYRPTDPVTRAQMAAFLVRAYEFASGAPLSMGLDAFTDDNGNTHEANINKAVEAGLAAGTAPGVYDPVSNVRRDQMATFVARALDKGVEDGLASLPGPA